VVQASSAAAPLATTEAVVDPSLIAPPEKVFDVVRIRARIDALAEEGHSNPSLRSGLVDLLKDEISAGRDTIRDAALETPLAAREIAASYCYLTDGVVRAVYYAATTYMHPKPSGTKSQRITLMALGGYGRAEMAPFSDVDLLFLTPYKITAWAESVIESMLYVLWDLHLKVGHASRTVKDCLRLAREDYTIRTSLLETRYLDGDPALASELEARLHKDLFAGTSADFIEAKLAEVSGVMHRALIRRRMAGVRASSASVSAEQ